MSKSKFAMSKKLANIQKRLMGVEFQDLTLESLLPIIFTECCKENIMFWFNFIENACVLNLRDIQHENYELNIRLSIGEMDNNNGLDYYKEEVLKNAFLILQRECPVDLPEKEVSVSNRSNDETQNKQIVKSDTVPPSPIRIAMAGCEKDNVPITKQNLEKRLNLRGMTMKKKKQCIDYLRGMEE